MTVSSEIKHLIAAFSGQARTFTIPVSYVEFTGSLECGLLLAQIVFWSDRTRDADGWFYKTYEEWEKELLLNEYQVRKNCTWLKSKGFLKTKVKKVGGNPTLHYQLNFEVFSVSFLEFLKERNLKNSRNLVPSNFEETKPQNLEELSLYTEDYLQKITQITTLKGAESNVSEIGGENASLSEQSEPNPIAPNQPSSLSIKQGDNNSSQEPAQDKYSAAPNSSKKVNYVHPTQKTEAHFRGDRFPWQKSQRSYDDGFVNYLAKQLPGDGQMNPKLKARNYITNCHNSESGIQKLHDAWEIYQEERQQKEERQQAIAASYEITDEPPQSLPPDPSAVEARQKFRETVKAIKREVGVKGNGSSKTA